MAQYRTKYEPPEMEEALAAAEGLSLEPEEQLEIVASLMGLDIEEVRGWHAQRKPQRARSRFSLTTTHKGVPRSAPEVVVLKRRPRAA